MRIWTIQTEEAWRVAKETGRLKATKDHQDTTWPEAYAWMREQMVTRIAPLWGWTRWGPRKARPDLRKLRWNWAPEGDYVLIECDLPERSLLRSDFTTWHHVLNRWYVAVSEADDNAHAAIATGLGLKPGPGSLYERSPEDLRKIVRDSWLRIFDFDSLYPDYWGPISDRSTQACFWELRSDQVMSHKRFRAALPQSKAPR